MHKPPHARNLVDSLAREEAENLGQLHFDGSAIASKQLSYQSALVFHFSSSAISKNLNRASALPYQLFLHDHEYLLRSAGPIFLGQQIQMNDYDAKARKTNAGYWRGKHGDRTLPTMSRRFRT
jgi:hypothetical protein